MMDISRAATAGSGVVLGVSRTAPMRMPSQPATTIALAVAGFAVAHAAPQEGAGQGQRGIAEAERTDFRIAAVAGDAALVVAPHGRGEIVGLLGAGSDSLIVEGAGHWPHREGEDSFLARLIAFAGEVD
jgi:pimeloyl-ACP methyl ester carboxylesterase